MPRRLLRGRSIRLLASVVPVLATLVIAPSAIAGSVTIIENAPHAGAIRFSYTIYNGSTAAGGFDLAHGESRFVDWGPLDGGAVGATEVAGWTSSFSCQGAYSAVDARGVWVNGDQNPTCTVTHTKNPDSPPPFGPPPPEPSPGGACVDGQDNDGDAVIDFPADAGCGTPQDTTETGPLPRCNAYSVDRYTTLDVPAAEGILTNDVDPAGGGLRPEVTSLSFAATKLRLEERSGAFSYEASANDSSEGHFEYRVVDATGEVSQSVRVTILIDQPVPAALASACGASRVCTIEGTAGNDSLSGTAGADVICGYGGNDSIRGLGGDDRIAAGAGDDVVDGLEGNDQILGGPGDDVLHGGIGDDAMEGEAGDDTLRSGQGKDTLGGGLDNDLLGGGSGDDRLNGGDGEDTATYLSSRRAVTAHLGRGSVTGEGKDRLAQIENVHGSRRNDKLTGSGSANNLDGKDGEDRLNGGAGDDLVIGGAGRDRLVGGAGTDILTDGVGTNRFVGGAGNDFLYGRNSISETLDCGRGFDYTSIDRKDSHAGCERVLHATLPQPGRHSQRASAANHRSKGLGTISDAIISASGMYDYAALWAGLAKSDKNECGINFVLGLPNPLKKVRAVLGAWKQLDNRLDVFSDSQIDSPCTRAKKYQDLSWMGHYYWRLLYGTTNTARLRTWDLHTDVHRKLDICVENFRFENGYRVRIRLPSTGGC